MAVRETDWGGIDCGYGVVDHEPLGMVRFSYPLATSWLVDTGPTFDNLVRNLAAENLQSSIL